MKLNVLKSAVLSVVAITALAVPVMARAQTPRSPQAQAAFADVKKTLGVVPAFIREMPDENVAPFWDQLKTLQLNPKTALSGKTKELIGLAVAAQIPCRYCIYAHAEFAKLNGASERELREAIATAGIAREMSALTNGQSPDTHTPEGKASGEAQATYQDIEKTFGAVPEFLRLYPTAALPRCGSSTRPSS
jgi:AhpD family alkylhydroperoxidase